MQLAVSRCCLVGVVAVIFAMGLVMIFSTTSAEVLDQALEKGYYQALLRQFFYACLGVLLGYGLFKLGVNQFLRLSPLLLVLLSLALILVFVPGIGKEINGSKRWLNLFGFSFQPSEFVKLVVPATFIFIMQQAPQPLSLRTFLKIAAPFAIPVLLILIEPNNGTAGVIVITLLLLCLLMNIPWRFWAMPLAVVAVVGALFASQLPYVQKRLHVYLHPEADLQGKGHQPYQAKIAAGSGGFLGKGPGQSWQKLSYLPEAQNDYIAAIYAEEFGFFGMIFLIVLYMLLTCLGFARAMVSKSLEESYLMASITFLIGFQAFLNLGVVSGILPSTGLNLPFFSQGGSSLMANLCGVGLLLSPSVSID